MLRPPILDVRNLRKVYGSARVAVEALRGVDLVVERGEYVAIVGPSGSGKSTLLNVLGCLDRPTSGQYLLDGVDTAACSDDELAALRGRRIGFVFQSYNLLGRTTALANVELPLIYQRVGRRERRRRATEVLDRVGLSDRLDHAPSELSGGQQQRVAIARALVTQPALLLADEPTGNLDSRSGEDVLALLAELHREGTTIMMITHEAEVASVAERRLLIRDGLVLDGDIPHDSPRSTMPDADLEQLA